MAADICSEISGLITSPRISFSYDLNQTDDAPSAECRHLRSDALLLDFSSDFDFCISTNSFHQEISSADELFSDGKILPTQIKKVKTNKKVHISTPSTTTSADSKCGNAINETKIKSLKEFLFESLEEEKPASKSFWQFKRSTSLNCDNGRSKGLIRSLQILTRSNSTGSAPNSKQSVAAKVNPKQHLQKQPSFSRNNQHFPSYHHIYNSSARPPLLKKCKSNGYGSGVGINPVLNIPPAYISKGTANLFGFGSFFCNGKSRKKKK